MNFDISHLLDAYRSGSLQPADVVREAYKRIGKRGERPVWIHVIPEAESLRRAEALGPFNDKLPLTESLLR